jgi:hypothetical protein
MKRFSSHFIVLGAYVALALGLTWPLVLNLTTHIPGTAVWAFDESTFVWNMWWFKYSLLNLGQTPLSTDYIFYPIGIELVLYTFNFFNAMLGLPLQMVMPLPLASNLVILFAYVSGAYGAYLLVCYLLAGASDDTGHAGTQRVRIRVAAFVAGAAYAFAASRMIYAAMGHYDIVTAQWFPFYALFLLKTLRQPGVRSPILAGIFAALALLAEMIFGVFLLFLSLILLAAEIGRLRSDEAPRPQRGAHAASWLPIAGRLLVLAITTAIVWSPVMIPVLHAFLTQDYALTGWGEGLKLSADLVGWFTPTALHPVMGTDNWPARLRSVMEGNAPFLDVNTVFLGYGVLVLAVIGAIAAWRKVRAWAWGAVIFAILTLGPLLQIKGRFLFPLDNLLREQGIPQDVTFPLPYALLHYIPFVKANRAPNRFSVVLSLALAVLLAYGIWWLLRRLSITRHTPVALLCGAVLLAGTMYDQVSVPLPLTDARVPAPYTAIAAEEGDFAILQLPLGWRNSFGTRGAERTQLQYYQSAHHKRMLAGNTSRSPAFKFDYFTRIPLIRALTETELYQTIDEETMQRAHAQAGELMALYDIRYFVVHDTIPLRYPYVDTKPAAQELALSLLPLAPDPIADADGVTVYRVVQPAVPDVLRVDFGEWQSAPYRGAGWTDDEVIFAATADWVNGDTAQFFFPVRGDGERQLSMQIAPFAYAGGPAQRMQLWLNGSPLPDEIVLSEGWQVVTVELPAAHLKQGLNVLTLSFDHSTAPSDVLPGVSDTRQLAAAVDWIEITTTH